jgi:hypothetical protein
MSVIGRNIGGGMVLVPGIKTGDEALNSFAARSDAINRAASADPVFVWEPGPPAQTSGILTNSFPNVAATGYCSPVGVVPAQFNAIRIPIRNNNSDFRTDRIWVRVRENDGSGTILAEGRATISTALLQNAFPWIRLDRVVNSTSSLFVEFTTSGRTDRFLLANASLYSGSVAAIITGGTLTENSTWAFGTTGTLGTGQNIYCQFGFLQELPSQGPVDVSACTWRYNASTDTFSAWAGPIGTYTCAVDTIMVPCWPNSSTPLTDSRLVVRDGSSSGAILAQASLTGLSLDPGRLHNLTYRLDKRVPIGTSIWLEVLHNAPSGFLLTQAGAFASPTARYSTSSACYGGVTWQNSATQYSPWCRVVQNDPSKVAPSQNAGPLAINQAIDADQAPVLIVPRLLYAIENWKSGDTGRNDLSLYNSQVLLAPASAPVPENDYLIRASVGAGPTLRQDANRVIFQGGTASSYSCTYVVSRGSKLLDRRVVTVNVVANTNGSGTRRFLAIGDSLTDPTTGTAAARGQWLAEMVRLFNGDSITLALRGARTGNKNDSTAVSRALACEGRAGWTVSQFMSVGSPLFNGANLDIPNYISGMGLTSGDYVAIFLGTNDIASEQSDQAARVVAQTAMAQLKTLVAAFRAAVSGIRILLLTIPTGAEDQTAYGAVYGGSSGTGQNRNRFRRNALIWNQELCRAFESAGFVTNNQHVVHAGAAVDPFSGYPSASAATNGYDSTSVAKGTDPVHWKDTGNFQFGYAVASYVKGLG